MDIDEAIKELENYNSATFETHFVSFSEALQLGIEALNRILVLRSEPFSHPSKLLKGETEEEK